MRYSEFREYLKGTDFELIEDDVLIQVNTDGLGCVKIAKNTHRQIILPFAVEEPEQFELIRKALELAETPLSKRGEEKKYYLKHRFINDYSTRNYINVVATEDVILSGRLCEDQVFRTKFTKAEIEELKEKFDTDLRDFEIIEVKE